MPVSPNVNTPSARAAGEHTPVPAIPPLLITKVGPPVAASPALPGSAAPAGGGLRRQRPDQPLSLHRP